MIITHLISNDDDIDPYTGRRKSTLKRTEDTETIFSKFNKSFEQRMKEVNSTGVLFDLCNRNFIKAQEKREKEEQELERYQAEKDAEKKPEPKGMNWRDLKVLL